MNLFDGSLSSLDFKNMVVIILFALITGVIIAICERITSRKMIKESYTFCLVILPIISSIIILFVGNDIAQAFTLAGIFSIIRFRSNPISSKDLTYVLLALASGYSCGRGYPVYGIILVLFVVLVIFVLELLLKYKKKSIMKLVISVPEDINYDGIFDDIVRNFTISYSLDRVKSTDFGTMVELVYTISMQNDKSKKELIDEIRCRNGNMNVNLVLRSLDE